MTDPASPTDPLSELRDQVRAATEAAERLAADTASARAADGSQEVPPAGWATPDDQATRQQELQALVALVEALRGLVPAELEQPLRDVLRQVLLLVRALVDWSVERLDAPGEAQTGAAPEPAPSEEIPID